MSKIVIVIRGLQEKCDEDRHYLHFELIFCGREGETILHEARILLLVKLCSLAVQYPCHSLLEDVALWLNKVGLSKSYAKQVVTILMDHFCRYELKSTNDNPALHTHLCSLASNSPDLAVYLFVLPFRDGQSNQPLGLFAVLAEWLHNDSQLIMTSLTRGDELTKVFLTESFPNMIRFNIKNTMRNNSHLEEEIFACIHTGLLQLILTWNGVNLLSNEVICALIRDEISSIIDIDQQKLALDRLSQMMQVAITNKVFSGSIESVEKHFGDLNVAHDLFAFIFHNSKSDN